MKGFAAAVAAAFVGLGAAAQAEPAEPVPAPAEVTCVAPPPGARSTRCELTLDLSGRTAPLVRSPPETVAVSRRLAASRRTVIDEPSRPEPRAVWIGRAVLTAQSDAPVCARGAGEDAWFPRTPARGLRRGALPMVVEPQAGACAARG